jgi:hypothetical protein
LVLEGVMDCWGQSLVDSGNAPIGKILEEIKLDRGKRHGIPFANFKFLQVLSKSNRNHETTEGDQGIRMGLELGI